MQKIGLMQNKSELSGVRIHVEQRMGSKKNLQFRHPIKWKLLLRFSVT